MLARLVRDGRVDGMPVVINTRSGARRSTLASAVRFEMDDCDYLVVSTLDVTDLERARLLRTAILQRASIGIAVTRDNRFVQANPFFERMFGWAPACGKTPRQRIANTTAVGRRRESLSRTSAQSRK